MSDSFTEQSLLGGTPFVSVSHEETRGPEPVREKGPFRHPQSARWVLSTHVYIAPVVSRVTVAMSFVLLEV